MNTVDFGLPDHVSLFTGPDHFASPNTIDLSLNNPITVNTNDSMTATAAAAGFGRDDTFATSFAAPPASVKTTPESADKSMPFDVNTFSWNSTLATFMVELTAPSSTTSSTSTQQPAPLSAGLAVAGDTMVHALHESAVMNDARLDSPLGLSMTTSGTSSGSSSGTGSPDCTDFRNTSPLSELLASPLFSDTMSMSAGVTPFDSAGFFPPLESIAPSVLSLGPSHPPTPHLASVDTVTTTNTTTTTRTSTSSPAPPTATTRKADKIALDAPVQRRNYAIPSSTSRKRKTVAVERALAKRAREGDDRSTVGTPNTRTEAGDDEGDDDEAVPDDLLAAVERKRLQNTLSARRARQRKAEHVATLEAENAKLQQENEELRRRLRMYEP